MTLLKTLWLMSFLVLAATIPAMLVEVDSGEPNGYADFASQEKKFVGIERVYPNLRFHRPVYLTGAGDGSGRIFVVEQDGVIRVFDSITDGDSAQVKDSKVFLDISERVNRRGNEEGLLGLTFHPDFANNGQFFVHYSLKSEPRGQAGAPNIVARYRVDPNDPDRADVDSEEVIMKVPQPYSNHNGGMIEFGPDGFLYITLGDGGAANDPKGNGQSLSTILGSIIRIDVDNTQAELNYAIPADNPFVDVENARPELWAVGLRNVWRFSFDRETGELYAADVGQDKIEEVNIIEKGGNYGWNRYEANSDFNLETDLAIGTHSKPVAMYERSWGISITGGYVYRGTDYPELNGKYFYGDYVSGNLWALAKNDKGEFENELVRRTGRSIASFGEDDRGELYILSFDGGIYRVVSTDEPENTFADWPQKLSETGLLTSMKDVKFSSELIPYELNAPFWSDGAAKQRFIKLPPGENMTYDAEDTWQLPVGTVIVKHFSGMSLGREVPLETRLIKRTQEGWEAATYAWNQALEKYEEIEAHLVPAGKQFEMYKRGERQWNVLSWHAPSSSECASCHVDTAGFVLGLTTAQLNRDVDGKNQIATWSQDGLVELPESFDADQAARFCDPSDKQSPLDERARVYLDVNCAMCHQPNGPGNANIDLRYATALDKTRMIGEPPAQGDMGIAGAKIVAPGAPDNSLLLTRMETLSAGRMPNVGSNIVDEKAARLLREWIEAMQ